MVNFEGSIIFLKFNPICNFLTINFYENLHEYFFVHNQFLIMKMIKIIEITNIKLFPESAAGGTLSSPILILQI